MGEAVWDAVRIFLGSPSTDELALAAIFTGSIIAFSFVPRIAEALVGGAASSDAPDEDPSSGP